MGITAGEQYSSETTPELLYFFGNTETNGITYGSPLNVPYGYFGIVLMNNQVFGAVGAGDYIIDGQSFPQLAQKLRLQPGQMPTKPVQLAIFLVNANETVMSWTAYPFVTKNSKQGANYCELRGRCGVRVTNPITFYNAFKTGWAATLKNLPAAAVAQLNASSPGKQAEAFVIRLLKGSASIGLNHMKLSPEQVPDAAEPIRQTVGMAAAAALQDVGLQCSRFEISNPPVVRRSPCVSCGSATAPTAYGVYHRTISLVYVRFGAKREGNFCVPCSAKISASYNAIMLVMGWWGIIGLVLTPIYFIMNCVNFLSTAFGKKLPSVLPSQQAEPGVWPPPPVEEWGQEVTEKGR